MCLSTSELFEVRLVMWSVCPFKLYFSWHMFMTVLEKSMYFFLLRPVNISIT